MIIVSLCTAAYLVLCVVVSICGIRGAIEVDGSINLD
jgi:hypothetical protein